MKKIYTYLSMLIFLLAASCQQEDLATAPALQPGEYRFNVTIPEPIVASRALGEQPQNVTDMPMHVLVFDENGWEFFAEFKRWFQLQRTERIYDVNHGYTDAFGVQREANPRVRESMDRFGIDRNNRQIYLMPLPSREVMDCGFTQNPSF